MGTRECIAGDGAGNEPRAQVTDQGALNMRRGFAFWILSGWVATVASTTVSTQVAQRSAIVGRVVDATNAALQSATVTLGGASVLGGERRAITDREGRYRFDGLLPGTYDLSADAPGLTRSQRPGVRLPVETTWTVDFQLEVSPMQETVDIVSAAPLVDVTTGSTPARFERELLQNLPTGRSLESVLNLAPGVTDNVAFGGTQVSSNSYSVDRVSTVETLQGKAWTPVPYNWLESVQVVALGAPAEYGQFTGALTNGVLRSGSNRFSGLGEFIAYVPDWTADNTKELNPTLQAAFTPKELLESWDANGQVGGPLQRDRLWFFAGLGTIRERFRPFGYSGPASTDRTEPSALVKVDSAMGRVQLQGFYQRDVSNSQGVGLGPDRPTLDSTPDGKRRNHVWNARATWAPSAATFIELRSGGYTGASRRLPHPPATLDGPPVRRDLDARVFLDNTPAVSLDDRAGVTTALRFGHRRSIWRGDHDLTAGLEFESADADSFTGVGGGRVEEYAGGVLRGVMLWNGNRVRTSNTRTTLYVQDRLSLSDVTLEPGLRLDMYGGRVPDGEVFRTTPLALRFGVAWDIQGRHRTVARAHFGRYYDMSFSYIYSWYDVEGITPRISGVETETIGFVEVSRFLDAAPPSTIDPDLKQAHVDQWTTGIDHQLLRDLAVEARYIHRRFGNFIGYVDRRLDEWTSFTVQDPGPDGIAGNADDGGMLTGYREYPGVRDLVITNPDGAYRRYDALQFIARKRNARGWEMQGSYTWSRSVGTIGGVDGTNYTFSAMSPGGYGAAPNGPTSLRDAGTTRSQFDYSEVKLLGFYHAPWLHGATLGAVYRWYTGSRWHRQAFVPGFGNLVAETPNSRQLPSIARLDLRVEKTFRLTVAPSSFGVFAEAFNVTNVGRPLAYVRQSGPRFGQPSSWMDPRTIRIGVRYSF
jgi:hypothetical protein